MIGAALPRLEDERFLTGRGRFVDDLLPSEAVFAYVLRSPHAHARICVWMRRPPGRRTACCSF